MMISLSASTGSVLSGGWDDNDGDNEDVKNCQAPGPSPEPDQSPEFITDVVGGGETLNDAFQNLSYKLKLFCSTSGAKSVNILFF